MSHGARLPRLLGELALTEEIRERVATVAYDDAGHGYDALGLHRDGITNGLVVTRPLYDLWFRVRSSGIEHIPASGPALLAVNHSGMLPLDAMMLWHDVLRQTKPPRVLRVVMDLFVPWMPVVSTLFAGGGAVSGSRGNLSHLLDHGELVAVFPEGVGGIAKGFSKRYELQTWHVGHAELALEHRVPIVPVAIVGAEEAWPQLGTWKRFHWFGAPHLPIPATPLPLPVRFEILYGEPLALHARFDPRRANDPDVAAAAAFEVKTAVQALLSHGLARRRGWFQ